jgi:hypothetical protein
MGEKVPTWERKPPLRTLKAARRVALPDPGEPEEEFCENDMGREDADSLRTSRP